MIGLVDGNNFYVSCERVFNRKLVGKPVAVLSNNDGCCVALSPEMKACGVARGTPYFQLKNRASADGFVFCSSNYELYGDLSRRIISILREEAMDVAQYSIDEAFIEIGDGWTAEQYTEYGRRLRAKILRWVGIPCGVGFAKTKTLAKIANHIGKKRPDGVFVMHEDTTGILAELSVSEVWGVGRRLPIRLRAERIFTAQDLRDARDDVVRAVGGVTLLRTAAELRGISCNQDRAYDADPDSISCSRSFGTPVTSREALAESIANFASQAAVKLRKHRMLASGCNVYAQVAIPGPFCGTRGVDATLIGRTVVFPQPTDETHVMLRAIRDSVDAIYSPTQTYRKSGIVFFGLEHVGAMRQMDLFTEAASLHSSKLYKTIDQLNAKLGRGAIFSAAEGITDQRAWAMRRDHLSSRFTTSWKELPTVR